MDSMNWLQNQVEKYAKEKEEIYNDNVDDSKFDKITTVHPLLLSQIETIYKLLDEKDQKSLIRSVEDTRKRTGPVMKRKSKLYFYVFIQYLIPHIFFKNIFRKTAEKNWDLFKKNVFPYNPKTNKTLRLEKWLGIQEDQNVFLVVEPETQTKWVMKWEKTDPEFENSESLEYRKLESLGAQCPKRLDGYYMLNFSVLVIEFLQPLDTTDNAIELAKQLLTTQLKYIHTYACYFDLKPDNIRKRPSTPPLYFIIDMNLSKEAFPGGGYKRLHFTPLYSSQSFPRLKMSNSAEMILSTYKNDFIELIYVVHQMIARRAYESRHSVFDPKEEKKEKQAFGLLENDYFADPDRMNNNTITSTRRGWMAAKSMLEYPLSVELHFITSFSIKYILQLPNFPPCDVHEKLFSTFNAEDYDLFMKKTSTLLQIRCQICSSIPNFRCGDCYNSSAFLCSSECAIKHKCN